jgi:Flp pilus assembly protein TadD
MARARWQLLICVVLFAATWAVFFQVRQHEFIDLDDPVYVTQNDNLRLGLTPEGIGRAFAAPYETNWIPLTWISFLIDQELFELEPAGVLSTNVLLHSLSVLLLFGVMVRMTGATWPSAFVAGVFAVHPLHVESVAWASERKDVLSGLFWMLSLWAYVRYAERPASLTRYLQVVVFMALGLLAKPMLVTLPCVLLLLDFWPLRRSLAAAANPAFPQVSLGRALLEKLPLFVLAIVSSVITFLVQESEGAMVAWEAIPFSLRVQNALVAYVGYLGKTFWPSDLAIFYPHPWESLPLWKTGGAALLLGALSMLALRRQRCQPYLLVGWFWYLGTLVPVIGLVQVGTQAMADRYTYIPSIGVSLAIAWGATDLVGRSRAARLTLASLGGASLMILVALAWLQVRNWRDSVTIFEHSLRATGPNSFLHNALGSTLLGQEQLEESLWHFRRAVQLKPGWAPPRIGMAEVLAKQGQLDAAILRYQQVLRLQPDNIRAHTSLGIALIERAEFAKAAFHLSEALRLGPDTGRPLIHGHLGIALARQGKTAQAIDHYREALRIAPDFAKVHGNLGVALVQEERLEEAMDHFVQAARIDPQLPEIHAGMALIFQRWGQGREAVQHYETALRLRPGWSMVANNLAWLLATDSDPGVRSPAEAIRLAESISSQGGGSDPQLLDTLAVAYAAGGRFEDALRVAGQASRLARKSGDMALAEVVEARIELFERGESVQGPSAGLRPASPTPPRESGAITEE